MLHKYLSRRDFLFLISTTLLKPTEAVSELALHPDKIRAVYLGTNNIFNERKISELENIFATVKANGIVIDFKDSNFLSSDYLASLVKRFKKHNIYVIARIVVFQDSYFARQHPGIAIKTSDGSFWYSGRRDWKRYWLDPASALAQEYNIETAKRAIDSGFDEIQFDYIRFPTDGNMKDMHFPFFNPERQNRARVMKEFFKKINATLKNYSPKTLISIDVFGETFVYGEENLIGQNLENIAEYFDVISPMAYPSHYMCNEFGLRDPTANPYKVYYDTLRSGKNRLQNRQIIIRPWIQDFTIGSIYGCGPTVFYSRDKVIDQIRAGKDLGINGFMLWNVNSNFTIGVFEEKINAPE